MSCSRAICPLIRYSRIQEAAIRLEITSACLRSKRRQVRFLPGAPLGSTRPALVFLEGRPHRHGRPRFIGPSSGPADRTIVAVPLEALNDCPVARAGLPAHVEAAGLGDRVRIPVDGQTLSLQAETA